MPLRRTPSRYGLLSRGRLPVRMTEIELSDSCIEAIARRVVELLRSRPNGGGLVDAAELARRLGVTRDWVYRHSAELGAIRLGDGAAPRLRFDPDEAMAAMKPPEPQRQAPTSKRRSSRPRWTPERPVPLLPVYEGASVLGSRPPRP
jgi:hypothetical protein